MQNEMEEKFEDWKGRDAIPGKHGGFGAASIACGKKKKLNSKLLVFDNNNLEIKQPETHNMYIWCGECSCGDDGEHSVCS